MRRVTVPAAPSAGNSARANEAPRHTDVMLPTSARGASALSGGGEIAEGRGGDMRGHAGVIARPSWRKAAKSVALTHLFGFDLDTMPETATLDPFDRALLDPRAARQPCAGPCPGRDRRPLRERGAAPPAPAAGGTGSLPPTSRSSAPAALGLTLTMHVLVTMERENSAVLDAFARKIARCPEVHGAWYVTGDSDFVLLVRVADMAAYERFSRAVLNDDPNVRAFRTLITIRELVEQGAGTAPR